jgi:hypothetical protein
VLGAAGGHPERREGLAVAVGGVLEQRQLGRVAEDFIECERRVASVETMICVPNVECWSEMWV